MTNILHYPTCRADYPGKPDEEAAQDLRIIELDDGDIVFFCVDCGAYVSREEDIDEKAQHPNTTRSTISGPTSIPDGVFISQAHELSQMFTQPAWHDPVKAGKYLEGGLKPVEAFCSDIKQNLLRWAVDAHAATIFYRTPDYWYMFQLVPSSVVFNDIEWTGYKTMGEIVWMTRYRNESWERLDDWANPHSVEFIGREFLADHADKRVPLFNTGE